MIEELGAIAQAIASSVSGYSPSEKAFLLLNGFQFAIFVGIIRACRARARQFDAEMKTANANNAALANDRNAVFDRLLILLKTIEKADPRSSENVQP